MKDDYNYIYSRNTTASGNSLKEIEDAVVEWLMVISRNNLIKTNLLSITFTATKDLMHVSLLQLLENVLDLIQLHF